MLFADDMVILSNSPDDLQCSLNLLYNYCEKWCLQVNVDKTKIVVFRNRGPGFVSSTLNYASEIWGFTE